MAQTQPQPVPEQGQLVKVRGRHFLVQDVSPGSAEPSLPPMHRVRLEALDDDQLGESLDVVWEHEVHPEVHDALDLPRPESWDPLPCFDAFLLASRWSLTSVLDGLPLQAPFRGAIQIEEFQLEPVVRALRMPRVNLLIADDVGLGKTIEAGMVIQEMLARQRIRRILVVCPASLQRQWAEEMLTKFALRFEIVDRDSISRLRREYGSHVNPWAAYPRLITSMDFLKREAPLESFMASLRKDRSGALRDWDLLVLDEAHNAAPSGRSAYVRDSDRTGMIRQVLGHFEHRLFLTATPHNGFTESFTALLEMLDPLRFARGNTLSKDHLQAVMVRRLKDDLVDPLGRRVFPRRRVEALEVTLGQAERQLLDGLDAYMQARLTRSTGQDRLPVRFALTLLKKRLLSSPRAFYNSIQVHQSHLAPPETPGEAPGEESTQVVLQLKARLDEDFADDDEKDRTEETAQAEASAFFRATAEEAAQVDKLVALAGAVADQPDSKIQVLAGWVEEHLFTKGTWNGERLLVFTEYRDTLDYLYAQLALRGWGDRLLTLHGGAGVDREGVKAAFRADPADNPVRILLATDAASEGLNLQDHCRFLLHWEIPWNPNKMEQRNGRIDRHGQKAEEVLCQHFAYQGWEDQHFLDVVVDKVRTQRADLGAVGDVIAAQVEQALRGERKDIQTSEDRRKRMQAEVRAEVMTQQDIRSLRAKLETARETWRLYPETLKLVLEEGLHLAGHPGLEPLDSGAELAGKAWFLRNLPAAWADCRPFIQDSRGRLLKLVFDERVTRGPEGLQRREEVSLLHLDHPLLKRALGVFRANLWSVGLHASHRLSRVSYGVVPDRALGRPVLLLLGRLVAVSTQGVKLHEDLVPVGGEIQEGHLELLPPDRLQKLLDLERQHPPMSAELGGLLRKFFPAHEAVLRKELSKRQAEQEKELKARLGERAKAEAASLKALVVERQKEVHRRIQEMEKELKSAQLDMFDAQERDQYQRDLAWLRGRKEQFRDNRDPAMLRQFMSRGP